MSKPLYDDPVVAEVHRIRAALLAECGGDFEKLMPKVREDQTKSGLAILKAPRSGSGTVVLVAAVEDG